MKHNKKPMSLEDVIMHIKIEKYNKLTDMPRDRQSNANAIEAKP